MNQLTRPAGPAHYELRVEGHLDQHWSAWFGGLTLNHQDDGTTTLRGPVTDQAQLHGMLAKVCDLGVTLISVSFLASVPDQQKPRCANTPSTRTRRTWMTQRHRLPGHDQTIDPKQE